MKKKSDRFKIQLSDEELFYKSDDGRFTAMVYLVEPNLLKLTVKGYANLICAIQNTLILDRIFKNAQQSDLNQSFYLIANLIDFKGTNSQARQHYVRSFAAYFEEGTINWIAFISPNWSIRSLAELTTRLNKEIKFSYHSSEDDALKKLRMAIDRENDQDLSSAKIKNNFDKYLVNNKWIDINGHSFLVKALPHWKMETEDFQVSVATLNNYIILSCYKGILNSSGVKILGACLKDAIEHSKSDKLYHVMDGHDVIKILHGAKKGFKNLEIEINHYFTHSYFILKGIGKIFYSMYKILNPQRMMKRSLANSFYTAICHIISDYEIKLLAEKKPSKPFPIVKKDIRSASKEELINIIDMQNEALNSLWENQKLRVDELLEIIGRITWDESFSPKTMSIESEDPFYYLYGAVAMVQQDVFEMIEELKQLNKTLEDKIALRTKKLKLQNNELKKVNDEMDRFFYIVAHDLRAPLASLLGLVNLFKAELFQKESPVIEDYFNKMKRSIGKMDNFITDITKYYRNKRLEIKSEKLNLKEIINRALDDLYDLNEKNIKVIINVRQDEPFYSDKMRMQIVLNNLVSNAIRYSRISDEEQSFLAIDAEVQGGLAEINVRDNGQGIAMEHLNRVFEMFYRASEEKSGSGLGLYIVKEIVEKLNGTIAVQSKIKVGTTFTIKIPSLKPTFTQ